MRLVAYALFVIGLLLATTQAVFIPDAGEGLAARVGAWFDAVGVVFLLGLAMMVAGAVLARRAATKPSGGVADDGAAAALDPVAVAAELLAALDTTLAPLDGENLGADSARRAALKAALDDVLEEKVSDFLELRPALMDAVGLEVFAEMIGHFASMERNAARAWSALTDEAYAEVGPCLDRARASLRRARDAFPAGGA